jgi:hypothetical protein
MRIAIALAATAALLGPVDLSLACSCTPPPSPLQELAESDAVFSGTVTTVELDESGLVPVRRIKFDVAQCWKGGIGSQIEIRTRDSEAACGRHFTFGVEYLVYAAGTATSLHTHLCDRTRRLAFAQEDLDQLGQPHCTTTADPATWSATKRIYR